MDATPLLGRVLKTSIVTGFAEILGKRLVGLAVEAHLDGLRLDDDSRHRENPIPELTRSGPFGRGSQTQLTGFAAPG
jgi:hypothetical protein